MQVSLVPNWRWKLPNRIPLEYMRALRKLVKSVKLDISEGDTPETIVAKLEQASRSGAFEEYAYRAAMGMVNNVYKHGKHRWRTTVMESPAGRAMYEAIQKEMQGPVGAAVFRKVEENAKLIRTAPQDIAKELTAKIQKLTREGLRAEEISERLQKEYPQLLKSRLDLIARTEVSKAQTALTEARAQSLGLDWYVWRTSEDVRVRSSHTHMEGVLVRWSNPPSPEALDPKRQQRPYGNYHAGDTFNCRCYPEPVVSLDHLAWPCKVYYGGKITRMTRAQFEQLAA